MIQALEQRRLLAAQPVITEFMAKNGVTLTDAYGEAADWIEIANQGDEAIDLVGWHLTDSNNLAKWTFPSFPLEPGQIKLVFATSRDTIDPAGNVHTNFSLSQDGEKLALSTPDLTVVSRYSPDGSDFPAQPIDVAYGIGTIYDRTTLVGPAATKRAFVPTDGTLDAGAWTALGFDDSGWVGGTQGVGYDTGGYEPDTLPPAVVGQWRASTLGSTYANNATVAAWTDTVGGATAYASGAPKYIANGINGQPVVRFNPADGNDLLRVNKASNPLAGEEDFSVVVVFRANAGIGGSSQWYNNAGLVDAEISGSTNDWGIAVSNSSGGRVAAGIGAPDTTVYSAVGIHGSPHVAVFTRSGGTITLYLDGGNGVSANGSATARALSDVVFGGLQTNANYFNGDIAEIRMYDGAMNSVVAYNIAASLGATYGIPSIAAPSNELGAVLNGAWSADALNGLANNAVVSNWSSSVGTRDAVAAGQPRLVKNALNGHSVVRFNPSDGTNDNFRLAAAANPLAGATDFSVAIVFRTATPGAASVNWYSNSGLVDAEIGGSTNDWGIAFNNQGAIAAGIGNPDTTMHSNGGYADGAGHVVLFSREGETFRLSIDGGEVYVGTASGTARAMSDLTFGSIQTNLHYFTGDLAEIQTYAGALNEDAMHAVAGQLAGKYGIPLGASRYDPLIGVDLQTAMAGVASTALVRVPFNVNDPSQYDKLELSLQYDDGFIAYLNGVEIARRNVTGPGTWQSTANLPRLDIDAMQFERIDVSQHLGLLNDGANVLSFRIVGTGLTDPDLLLVPQLVAAKTTVGPAFLSPATPGAPNGEGYVGIVDAIAFSRPRGIYADPFDVTLSAATPGTTIVYTLDGSAPSLTNGVVVPPAGPSAANSVPLHVNQTATLRAVGVKNMWLPSTIGTQTYIFPASVLAQANTAPAGAYWDTEVDPDVVNATQTYSVTQALSAMPTMSLVMDWDDMFGTSGIYKFPRNKGRQWERVTSVEYFDPNGTTDMFQIDAGVRIQGGASRDPSKPKRSFRLYFRSEYGAGKLDAPGLFGADNPAVEFDHLTLRAGNNYSWANDPNGQIDFLRDEYARTVQGAINGYTARGSFIHLYINGEYWGVYNLVEEPDETWAAQHFGGDEDHYDLLEPDNSGGMELKSGTIDAWNHLFNTVDAAYNSGGIDNIEYAALAELVDMEALVGYMIAAYWRGDRDAPAVISNNIDPRNFYAFRRNDIAGKFYFQTWDAELSMDDVNYDRTELQGNQNPARLFYRLRTNGEFRQLVTDRLYSLFYNGGVLQVAPGVNKPVELYNTLVQKLDVGIVGESARWGDAKRASPFMRDTDWVNAVNWMRDVYLAARSGVSLNQFKNDFPAANLLPPTLLIDGAPSRGGNVAAGSVLTLVDQNTPSTGNSLYYTLDGTDPRLPGGGLSPTAIEYTGPVSLNANTVVTVRAFNVGTWSGKDRIEFIVAANGLRITEIAYNPVGGGDYEFVELQNTSLTHPLDISGTKFTTGITFTFPAGTILAPGEYISIAKHLASFQSRYGAAPRVGGVFSGSLANEGELLILQDADNNVLHAFAYANNWYPVTNGGGHSLVIRDAFAPDKAVWATAAGWRPSQEIHGSPGILDPDAAPVATMPAVTPNPRNTAVNTLAIHFNEPVTGFDLADLTLTLDTGPNRLTGAQTLTTSDGGKTWTLGNLGPLTGDDGNYVLAFVADTGIADLTGNALAASSASTSFGIDRAAPTFVAATFHVDGAAPQLRFTYDESLFPAGTPVLNIVPTAGGAPVSATGFSIAGNTITFDLPPALADGHYTATLTTAGVRDAAGNAPTGTPSTPFAFLAGDADLNGTVDFDDLLTLAQHYGQSDKTFTQGNFDFSPDGLVDFNDLLILAQRYGKTLPTLLAAEPPRPAATAKKREPAIGDTIR